jgi:hypothetical protein
MKYPNGSESVMSPGPFSQLIAVKHCPCEDGRVRLVKEIGTPDTYWTAPGRIHVKGRTVTGFVSCDEEGYTFHANKSGKNAYFLKVQTLF